MLDNRHIHARQFKSIWPYINVFFITSDNLTLRRNWSTMRMRGICRDFADLQFLKSAKELKLFFSTPLRGFLLNAYQVTMNCALYK